MATHDYDIANQSGANFRTDLNNCLDAIVSNNSNASDPSTTFAYMWWVDTSNNVLKLRNSANNAWITLPMSITASNTITPTLNMGTGAEEDVKIVFDGNAKDFYIALDDSADKLIIGEGSTVGTNSILTITDDTVTIGDGTEVDTKIVFDGNAQDYYIGLDDSADDLIIGKGSTVGTTPAIVIDENQKVGIGDTPDLAALHVKTADSGASADSGADELVLENSGDTGMTILSGTTSSGSIRFGDSDDNDNGIIIYNHGSTPHMRFFSNGSEAVRILNNQHLLVGTTSEYSGTIGNITAPRQIDIGANDANLKTLFFNRNAAEGEIGGLAAGITGFSTMGRINFVAEGVAGGSQSSSIRFKTTLNATEREVFRIDQIGQLFAFHLTGSAASNPTLKINTSSGFIYFDSSSLRYKENVQDFPSSLSKVNQLRPVTYDDKSTGEAGIGLIAEEVDEIAPELVTYKEIDGSLEPETVVYDRLTIHLLKGMQEQQDIIDNLKTRIETLEGA